MRNFDATDQYLMKIFTVPEEPGSSLAKIETEISNNLLKFLNENIAATEKPLHEIEKDFQLTSIPNEPTLVSVYTDQIMESLISHSVHTAAPSFIGHMTSSLPNFLLPFSKLMVGLNQNLVKIETSKAFTPLERQVLGMLHNLVYGQSEDFYKNWMHHENYSLGAFCSGGTIANITALWVARNKLLRACEGFEGINKRGLTAALRHYGYKDIAVLVSERGHYSLGKSADLLGIGRDNFIAIRTNENNQVDVQAMRDKALTLENQGIKILAIIGVAGTTETGSIDPLDELADLSEELKCHFHIDAAWGGATLLSDTHRNMLSGVERCDSITIDAHKQMYVPMGCGMVLFKDPDSTNAIEHHAEYILRRGSKDLGSHTLEGSRPGMALLVHACINILGREGYRRLIDNSISKAHTFSEMIRDNDHFELISKPQLCILTYRYSPPKLQRILDAPDIEDSLKKEINDALNKLTASIQKRQREQGRSFVSRTRLSPKKYDYYPTIVFRVVLSNPLTSNQILNDVLAEQKDLASTDVDFNLFLLKLGIV